MNVIKNSHGGVVLVNAKVVIYAIFGDVKLSNL